MRGPQARVATVAPPPKSAASVLALSVMVCLLVPQHSRAADPFYIGADVSMIPFLEQRGAAYKDNGQVKPAEQILANHGANLFRIRLMVNPSLNYDDPSNRGAIQDLNYDLALAQRLKATGAKVVLDLHYSDTWTNPGLQPTPAAWSGQSFSQLVTQVHDYTLSTLNAFKNAGVSLDMVQVGNEITAGMLWPSGQLNFNGTTQDLNASWGKLGQLLNSAIKGVRDAQPVGQHTSVIVTEAPGDEWYSAGQGGKPRWFYDNLMQVGGVTDFDILGIDSYPTNSTQLTGLKNNLNDLATRYTKKVMLMETNYPWKSLTGYGSDKPFPATQQGQLQFFSDLRDTVMNLPGGKGAGLLWWYPEATPVANTYMWQGGALGLFDSSGNALPAMNAFNVPEPCVGALAAASLLGRWRRRPLRA
jgi:arabinogalactan endo-1,4-beta-galactosidase